MSIPEEISEILVVLLELRPSLWTRKQTPENFASPLQQVLAFLNCFVLLNSSNEVTVFSIQPNNCSLIYQQEVSKSDQSGGLLIGNEVLESLQKAVRSMQDQVGKDPCLSAAISRALCYLNSQQTTARKNGVATKKGRILVVNVSDDVPGQYISFMNSVFAAQHSSILVDAVHLGPQDSSFLQQASHLTGGFYLKIKTPGWILQYLNTYFASGLETRKHLMMESEDTVNFAASCFCHERSIHLGFVCSVCLSVYCSYREVCLTCGTAFESSS